MKHFFRDFVAYCCCLSSYWSFARRFAVRVSPSRLRQPRSVRRSGLALQGGGALGLAHVGVITWMEEHHIPIDYISGTSMGGLVGGVYATGRNATELATGRERHQLERGDGGANAV